VQKLMPLDAYGNLARRAPNHQAYSNELQHAGSAVIGRPINGHNDWLARPNLLLCGQENTGSADVQGCSPGDRHHFGKVINDPVLEL